MTDLAAERRCSSDGTFPRHARFGNGIGSHPFQLASENVNTWALGRRLCSQPSRTGLDECNPNHFGTQLHPIPLVPGSPELASRCRKKSARQATKQFRPRLGAVSERISECCVRRLYTCLVRCEHPGVLPGDPADTSLSLARSPGATACC